MTVAELDITPRTRGRAAKPVTGRLVRELTDGDLALLASGRGVEPAKLKKLHDRHHALARCLAQGMTPGQASAITGYDLSRISVLKSDPTFKELLADYQRLEGLAYADFQDRAQVLSLAAMNEIQERLEESPEEIPVSTLIEVVKLTADRTGHAPVQKSMNMNVTVDMGSKLQAARQRALDARKALENGGNSGGPAGGNSAP